jgi:AcrR family transcriptional regulator
VNGAEASPVGRRRDASLDMAFRKATIEILAEVGYDHLTIDAVAARAGAGKATIYRRWANKAELVMDALAQPVDVVTLPDTGSVVGDFEALIDAWGDDIDQEFRTRLFSGLIPALVQFPELRVAFQKVVGGTEVVRAVLERGVKRGEIAAPKDLDLVGSLFPALSLYRLVMFDERSDAQFARTVLHDLIMPVLLSAPV